MYVKLQNHIQFELPQFDKPIPNPDWATTFPELADLQSTYQIEQIKKPFKTRSTELDRTYEFRFANHAGVDQLIRELQALAYIDYAEKVPYYYKSFIPDDYTANQYHLATIQAFDTWDLTQGSKATVIAIVDDAVNVDHVDLAPNAWVNPNEIAGNGIDDDNNGFVDDINGWDVADMDNDPNPPLSGSVINFDHRHGSHVAGCASAATNNGIGVAAIGFNCSIMGVKGKADASTGSTIPDGMAGVDYAIASGYADVINMSFGSESPNNTFRNVINAGHAAGIVMIAAAGNDGSTDLHYPAAYDHVISVGSTTSTDQRSWFSNYGTWVDLMAPGSGIRSIYGNGYGNQSGTSMSSPIVAGLAGLMLSVTPTLTPTQVEQCLKSTCDNIDSQNPGLSGLLGAGRINAYQAIACITVSTAPSAAFDIPDSFTCDGSMQFYDNSSDIPTSWFWDFGNGTTASGQNPVAQFNSSGTYTVTLTVNNSIGTDQFTQTVNVYIAGTPVVDAGPDAVACFGTGVQLNGTSDLPGTVSWSPNNNLDDPTILNPIATPSGALTYYLTVTTAEGCSATDTINVNVAPSPSTFAGIDVTIQAGGATQMQALGASTYEWSPTTGLSDPNIANPIASPTVSTLYTVTGYNADGCSKSDEVWVYVEGTQTNIEEAFAELGTIHPAFPNPAQDELQLTAEFFKGGSLRISLFDLYGAKVSNVYEGNIGNGSFKAQWKRPIGVASGIYLLRWELEGAVGIQKVVIE